VISCGIIRRLDNLGRIVLPVELRETLGIKVKDGLEVFIDGRNFVLKKYSPGCVLCDNAEELMFYKGKKVCKHCIQEISEIQYSNLVL